jgi:hypothetical protein
VDPGLDCNLSGPSAIMLSHLYVFGHYTADRSGGTGIFIYDPLSDTWASKPLLTTFSYWDETRLRAARVFVNGSPSGRGDRGIPSREQSAVHPIACACAPTTSRQPAGRCS